MSTQVIRTRGMGRRAFLEATGAAAVLVALPRVALAQVEETVVKTGRLEPGGPDWVYVPFDVPAGVREISVRLDYNRAGGRLALGVFDPDGYGLGNERGFRGRSSNPLEFTISRRDATPGYLPGDITPGTWNVMLDVLRVAPQGADYTITMTQRFGEPGPAFVPRPAPDGPLNNTPGWYRGDLHIQTIYSGEQGNYTPQEIVAAAVAAGLNFFASTEHNNPSAHLVWGRYARPDLLILNGEEVTTRDGHYNAVGLKAGHWIDWRYRVQDNQLPRFLADVHADGAIAIVNHASLAPCCPWKYGFNHQLDAMEVWNGVGGGAWTPDDEETVKLWDGMLRQGRLVTAVGTSDVHRAPNPIGRPHTVVRASRLGRREILEGIRAGRAYVAESKDVTLEFTARTGEHRADIGDRLESGPGTPVEVRLRVVGAPGTVATFHTQNGTVQSAPVASGDQTITWTARGRDATYVRAEVRRPDRSMVAFTNPLWIGQAAEAGGEDRDERSEGRDRERERERERERDEDE